MHGAAMRWRTLLLTGLLLAGCAETAGWQKDGVSAEDLQRDRVDCRRQADAQAEREAFGRGLGTPVYEVDRNTGQVREMFRPQRQSAALGEKSRAESLFQECMRARGYRGG